MRNFQDTFKTCKRSFINAFWICMTVPYKVAGSNKDSNTGVPCETCEIFKNTFFNRTPPVAASEFNM